MCIRMLPTLPGEGIPRVIMEAMAAGLPVVTSNVSGIPGLVAHERNGLLVDHPATPASVAAALRRLIQDGALRRRLVANGYVTARAHTLQGQAAAMMDVVSSRLGVVLRQKTEAIA